MGDFSLPFFTFLEFLFMMGWLKVTVDIYHCSSDSLALQYMARHSTESNAGTTRSSAKQIKRQRGISL